MVSDNLILRNDLIKKYEQIIVSCRTSIIRDPFKRAKFPLGENIAGCMGLGRLLYNLLMSHGVFTCVIEGFDCYLDSEMYSSYYPSLARDKNFLVDEQVICSGLAGHDPLFNFLYLKEVLEMVKIVDSRALKDIVKMTGKEYLLELSKVRKFETLQQQ